MNNGKSKEELARELRWYRDRRQRDARRIEELESRIRGYEELMGINNGIVAAVLRGVGATEEHPVVLARDAVTKAMTEVTVKTKLDTDSDCFLLFAELPEENSDRGDVATSPFKGRQGGLWDTMSAADGMLRLRSA